MLSPVAQHHRMKTFTKLHQVLHVLIRTHRVSFEVLCHKEWTSAWNSDQQPKFILINEFFQQFLIAGLQTVGEWKTFRVSSLSSAPEQRRLFAMHFVLRSSGNSSRWREEDGGQTGERGRSRKWRGRIKEGAP